MPIEIDTQPIQNVVEALPPLAAIVLGVLVVIGFVLWILGRSLVRPTCVVCGLVLGGLAGFVVGQRFAGEGAMTLPLILGGGIAGGLLAGLLFRVWMGISFAVILALAAPAASIVWQGTPLPLNLATVVNGDIDMEVEAQTPAPPPRRAAKADAAEPEAATLPGPVQALWERAKAAYAHHAEVVSTWWNSLGEGAHWFLTLAALAGAGVGLILGLAVPNWAATLQTALVGSVLMFYPGRDLLMRYAPGSESWLPWTPRAVLLSLGLITLLGVLLQWTLFRRRTDK